MQTRLVLAVYSYVKSEWFLACCKIATMFYCEITFKIKKLIGMDEFKDTEDEENRSWKGIKSQASARKRNT